MGSTDTTRTASSSDEPRHERGHATATDDRAAVAHGGAIVAHEPPISLPLELDLLLYERAALQPDDE